MGKGVAHATGTADREPTELLLSAQPDPHRPTGACNTTHIIANQHTQPVMGGLLRKSSSSIPAMSWRLNREPSIDESGIPARTKWGRLAGGGGSDHRVELPVAFDTLELVCSAVGKGNIGSDD
jgi:hypothetical protein